MARMYGSVQGSRGEATRLGGGHMRTLAATWQGAVVVTLRVESTGKGKSLIQRDFARIELRKWNGAGVECVLYDGPINDPKLAKLYPGIKSWSRTKEK